jgi:hypothetical protein
MVQVLGTGSFGPVDKLQRFAVGDLQGYELARHVC